MIVFMLALVCTACLGYSSQNEREQNTYLDLRDDDNNSEENDNANNGENQAEDNNAAEADENQSDDGAVNTDDLEVAPEIGALAPNFTLSTLTGEVVTLADFRGKVVMLNFWAVWCPPCVEELPAIQAVHDEYGNDVALLLVNSGDAFADVEAFIHANRYTFNCLLDPEDKVGDQYRVRGIPTTFFINEYGVIQSIQIGTMDENKILDYLVEAGFEQ
jgi:peroxiredoxin